ncbi:MAG: aminotransferase class V-fold PLP-dependent enzyme [Salinibacter sp.]
MSLLRRHFLKLFGSGTLGIGLEQLLRSGEKTRAGREATVNRSDWPPPAGVPDDTFWEMVRAQFPLTDDRTYLNSGGLGPAPHPVLDAMQQARMELQRRSETGHERIEAARDPVSDFFGVRPEEICFVRNATEGNSTVASGLELGAGDEVIFESHAHPGGAIPWMNRQKQDGVRVRVFEPDSESAAANLQRIEERITPRTKALQVSHVTAPTGIRFPVERIAELAHDHDVWFHIDGAQSAGMFPFDLKEIGCDSYATSGHKWMGAPHGTGILYVHAGRLDAVTPTEVGAYTDSAYEIPDTYDYHPTARRYESGTRDAAAVEGVVGAVRFLERIGMDRVAEYSQGLARYLQDRLRALSGVTVLTPDDPALSGAMTTFRTKRVGHRDLYQFLRGEYSLRCRLVNERGLDAVRVSTHIYNDREECDRVAAATQEAIENA